MSFYQYRNVDCWGISTMGIPTDKTSSYWTSPIPHYSILHWGLRSSVKYWMNWMNKLGRKITEISKFTRKEPIQNQTKYVSSYADTDILHQGFNTLRPEQNDQHFAEHIFILFCFITWWVNWVMHDLDYVKINYQLPNLIFQLNKLK